MKSETYQRSQTRATRVTEKPTDNEMNDILKSLSECKSKPVCLSLVDTYYESFLSSTRNIKTMPDLFEKSWMDLSYPELLQECNKVDVKLTKEEINVVERDTVEQATGKAFFRHCAGRIGASKCNAVCHSDPSQPSQSLIKTICYPDIFNFTTKATKQDCKHEASAIKAYEQVMRNTHL